MNSDPVIKYLLRPATIVLFAMAVWRLSADYTRAQVEQERHIIGGIHYVKP